MANLEREQSAGAQVRRRGGDQFANQLVAHRTTEKRNGGIVSHLGSELRGLIGGDVGKICDNQVERAFDFVEKMTLGKSNALQGAEALGIFARERERVSGKINGLNLRGGEAGSEGERDNTAARADIKHAWIFRPGEVAKIFRPVARFRGGG